MMWYVSQARPRQTSRWFFRKIINKSLKLKVEELFFRWRKLKPRTTADSSQRFDVLHVAATTENHCSDSMTALAS
jgi:hypothetical protein